MKVYARIKERTEVTEVENVAEQVMKEPEVGVTSIGKN